MARLLPHNISLCGFMGAGKSTVGPLLAKELGWSFIDTDRWIENQTNRRVAEIFEKDGEAHFRDWETRALNELSVKGQSVIALGGGSLLSKTNQNLILKNGLLIYLTATIPTLLKRLNVAKRPLLKGLSGSELEKHMAKLIRDREDQYRLAPLSVSTDGKSAKAISLEIIDEVSKWKR